MACLLKNKIMLPFYLKNENSMIFTLHKISNFLTKSTRRPSVSKNRERSPEFYRRFKVTVKSINSGGERKQTQSGGFSWSRQ